MKSKEIYKKAIETYGSSAQLDIAIEEMSELTKAILKNRRGQDNIQDIIEEFADVSIMMKQMLIIYNIDIEDIAFKVAEKTARLQERLAK